MAFDDPIFSCDSREARAEAMRDALASVGTGSFYDALPLFPQEDSKMYKVTALRQVLQSTRLSIE